MHLIPLVGKVAFAADPEALYERLRHHPHCVLLDSVAGNTTTGRYTILGMDPFCLLSGDNARLELHIKTSSPRPCVKHTQHAQEPLALLEKLIDSYSMEAPAELPFGGGAIGWLSYELAQPWFGLQDRGQATSSMPELHFAFYHKVIVIDLWEKTTWLMVSDPWQDGTYQPQTDLEKLLEIVRSCPPDDEVQPPPAVRVELPPDLRADLTREEYLARVLRVQQYIAAGDTYQVNFTQRFSLPFTDDPWRLYKSLRRISPCPFSAFLPTTTGAILSNSPERFLKWSGSHIETHPIKGTRPRGSSPGEDLALREALLQSAKDRAELVMITDLERNDLGRICTYGSIHVPQLCGVEGYPTVWHQVSVVCGQLKPHIGLAEILRSTFPGGSITGAPKKRAMEIIQELEPVPRGVYTGAIGYLSFHRTADFNIAIRTLIQHQGQLSFHVGGGIVADSIPGDEYEESLVKAQAMLRALEEAASWRSW